MDKLQAMKVFCRVYEAESFKVASESLDISRPMVTRYINSLEERLGTKLLHRNTRNISITHAGRQYYRHCIPILEAIEESENELSDLAHQPKGHLRLSVPMDFGLTHMVPILSEFSNMYPDITLELEFSDKRVDLTETGIDLAVRGGDLGGDQFIARPLCSMKGHVCASPEYIAKWGRPKIPADLLKHNCLVYTNAPLSTKWYFQKGGLREDVTIKGSILANNGSALTRLCLEGVGIIMQPDFLVDPYIKSGQLVPLLGEYETFSGKFYAVYAERKLLPRKVRLLIDFLMEKLKMPST
ncbi:LysR family transcriptional regulator [Marinomonas piezotolerans]|uniref:LysR family transcriptional regulator n=1 Tax=Marinomonas piezotolerans TaxID=2213058 RepID=A0A370U7L2_9GAMM|nr:LysR family transcriptional regulator [Marinomonas piezotolerans]RDL43728.1 LysR family transcriptional regulator [Marinomonas piezotolerans]